MSLRINRVRSGLARAISQSEMLNGDMRSPSATYSIPVLPIRALSRRETYQKMRSGQTTAQYRLHPLSVRHSDPYTAFDTSSAEFDAAPAASVLAALTLDTEKPRTGKTVAIRKTVMQLRLQSARKLLKPAKGLGKSGHDHDSLSDLGGIDYAEEITSNNVPAVRGPLDQALPVLEGEPTKPYRLLQNSESARRLQIETPLSP